MGLQGAEGPNGSRRAWRGGGCQGTSPATQGEGDGQQGHPWQAAAVSGLSQPLLQAGCWAGALQESLATLVLRDCSLAAGACLRLPRRLGWPRRHLPPPRLGRSLLRPGLELQEV